MKARLMVGCLLWLAFSAGSTTGAGAVTLGDLVLRCAPAAAPRTVLAIISVESGGYPWAIHDNTADKAIFPRSRAEAAQYIRLRLAQGAEISGIGLTQVNAVNLKGLGVSVDEILDPCTNIAMGMKLLGSSWTSAVARYGWTKDALLAAFEAYNGGPAALSPAYMRSHPEFAREVQEYATSVWDTAQGLPYLVGGR